MIKNLTMIANVSEDLGLGYRGELLWRLKPDMEFFRKTTTGRVVVMGGKTFESIGRALPRRTNVVLSRGEIEAENVKVFHEAAELDRFLEETPGDKFIIGGASLYAMYLSRAEKLLLTEVAAKRPADVFFPQFVREEFRRRVLESGEAEGLRFEIVEYRRK